MTVVGALKAACRGVGRLAGVLYAGSGFPPGWFRDSLASDVFARLLGDRIRREDLGTPCPFAGVRDAALSAGLDVTDYRFASELLGDMLVVRLEHHGYVVQDLEDRGCYCEPFPSGTPRHTRIPKTIPLAPESLVGFLVEFDREVPRIRAAADRLELEVGRGIRAREILTKTVGSVAADLLVPLGIPYTFDLSDDGVLFEMHPAGFRIVRVKVPLEECVSRIRELPYLVSHPEEGTARYGKDFKYVREGKIRCYSARNGTDGRTPGEPEVGGARLSHDQ